MSFGADFVTDFGNTLIDETFKSLAMASKGTIVTDTVHPMGSSKLFSYTGTHPLLALSDNSAFGISSQGKSGSNWQVEVFSTGAVGTSISYWLFDDTPNVAPTGFGMLVRNAAGQIVFDSNHKYLRVESFVHAAGTYALTAGSTYAVCFSNGHEHVRSVGDHGSGAGFNTTWSWYTASVSGANVNVALQVYQTGNSPDDQTYIPGLDLLITDVSNY